MTSGGTTGGTTGGTGGGGGGRTGGPADERARGTVPPGWPERVRPPGAPGWERTAQAWLLDLCPPDYRGHPVLVRHPVVLAWLAAHHLDGQLHATRRALATARTDLAGAVTPPALRDTLGALEVELARLVAAQRGASLVTQALRGVRYVPRL